MAEETGKELAQNENKLVHTGTIQGFQNSYKAIIKFAADQLKTDLDYGIIPGTKKKSLYKEGADKLSKFIRAYPTYEEVSKIEDYEKGFYFYKIRCILKDRVSHEEIGSALRLCNSWEKKYLFQTEWINGQKNRRKKTHEEQADQSNTIYAMAQKRAYVAAVVQASMAGEIFDMKEDDYNEEPPRKAVNREDDPDRVRILSRFFAVVQERGFTTEQAKQNMYKKFAVDTMADISNKDITETTEKLVMEWEPVEKGEKPKKIQITNTPREVEPIEEGEVVDEEKPELDDIDRELGITPEQKKEQMSKKKESIEPTGQGGEESKRNCYNCGKHLTTDDAFCDNDNKCKNEYWAKQPNNPYKKKEAPWQK